MVGPMSRTDSIEARGEPNPLELSLWDEIRAVLSETVARAKQGFDYVTYPEFAACIDKLERVVERSAPEQVVV
jgi:hypothetical protein